MSSIETRAGSRSKARSSRRGASKASVAARALIATGAFSYGPTHAQTIFDAEEATPTSRFVDASELDRRRRDDPIADKIQEATSKTAELERELQRVRESLSLHTLRLDEAEQALARQADLIDRQAEMIDLLRKTLADADAESAAARALAAADAAAAPAEAPAARASGVYVVKTGDTLSQIATAVGVSERTLIDDNDISNPNRIFVGQRLRFPAAPAPTRVAVRREAPTAEAGSDLATIGQQPPTSAAPASPPPAPTRVAAADNDDDAPKTPQPKPAATPPASATARKEGEADENLPDEVGQRPEEEPGRYIALLSDVGGILTPRGALFVEPEIAFTTTSDNRFFFQGVEILDALLIGAIEATDTDRRALTSRFGLRYGVTSRLELEGRVSHVYRDEQSTGVSIGDQQLSNIDQSGSGFGDAEAGLHYQLNKGRKWPYAIFNLRANAPTGTGPFDLPRDEDGIELELATGSGFWTVEPSFTLIAPTAPASIFANIGYQVNLSTSPGLDLGDQTLLEFDAGDALRANIGVGLSVNDRFSLSLGYNQSHFFRSKSRFRDDVTGQLSREFSPSATVGAFGFGGSYAVSKSTRVNLNAQIGATDEAPDATISLRLQKRLF